MRYAWTHTFFQLRFKVTVLEARIQRCKGTGVYGKITPPYLEATCIRGKVWLSSGRWSRDTKGIVAFFLREEHSRDKAASGKAGTCVRDCCLSELGDLF